MSGFGSCKWTCGECGESYEASGVVGDLKVNRWAAEHREKHRVDKLPPEEREDYYMRKLSTRFGA